MHLMQEVTLYFYYTVNYNTLNLYSTFLDTQRRGRGKRKKTKEKDEEQRKQTEHFG